MLNTNHSRSPQVTYTAYFDGLVDLVEFKGHPAFLVKEGNELTVYERYSFDQETILPPPEVPWRLPRAQEVLRIYNAEVSLAPNVVDAALYDELLQHHRAISELPDEAQYDLLAAWVMHTYMLEAVRFSPIICFYSVAERGKTRTGQGMIFVAYRGFHATSLREAYLLRIGHDLGCSLFADVKDVWQTALQNQSQDALLGRFMKGMKVPRVLNPDKGSFKDTKYYTVFGPTVLATNEPIDDTLETRGLTISMLPTEKNFENEVTEDICLPLRERLVAFRARHLGKQLPDIRKPDKGRLGDVLKPLHQVIRLARPEREEIFVEYVSRVMQEKRNERALSLEAQIIEAILGLDYAVVNGALPVMAITALVNTVREYTLTPTKIGRVLGALGFQKAKTANGSSAILWDLSRINKLARSFGLGKEPDASETPEPPVAG